VSAGGAFGSGQVEQASQRGPMARRGRYLLRLMITIVMTRAAAMTKALTAPGSMSMKGTLDRNGPLSATALAVDRAPDRAVRQPVQNRREPLVLNGDPEVAVA
jgi:hypothetical protein